jgi:hypothetical protein
MATAARGDDGVLTATGEGGIEEARLILPDRMGKRPHGTGTGVLEDGGRTLVAGARLRVGPARF